MTFLTRNNIKAIFALVSLLSVVVGFFIGLVPVEYFTGLVGMVIAHYFEAQKTDIVSKQLDEKVAEIESLKSEVKTLSNGQKEV